MRVTQNMVYGNLQRSINETNAENVKYNGQVASGKRFQKPSEDSLNATRTLGFKDTKANLEQYRKNVENGLSYMSTMEDAIASFETIMIEAKTLTIQGGNATLNAEDRKTIALAIDQLVERLYAVAGTRHDNDYIFSGFMTRTVPFDPADATYAYAGDTNNIQREVSAGTKITINLSGSQVFGSGATSAFAVLADLSTALNANDQTATLDQLDKIDTMLDQAISSRATTGVRMISFDAWKARLDTSILSTTGLISGIEDVDLSEAILNLAKTQTAYEATLASGAKIMQLSLLDFMR